MKKRWAASVIGCGLLGLGLAAWLFREELAAWHRFVRRFERLEVNERGYLEYRHRSTGMVMVRIPGGEFVMGSPETEDGAWANERPRHRVTLDAFLMAKHEVSQAIWRQVMGSEPSKFTGDALPVEQVSWDDCREFCRRTGLALPSEARWEYACRGGTTTPFACGESLTSGQANFDGNFPYVPGAAPTEHTDDRSGGELRGTTVPVDSGGELRGTTVPVDSFEPNGFGLHNMHGNVSEWCEDAYDEDFYGRPEATRPDPVCTVGSGNRVTRGGGWFDRARYCRSGSRAFNDPARRSQTLGFRPVHDLR